MVVLVTCTTTLQFMIIGHIMVNEPAEPSCPQWVETAGFTNPASNGVPAVGVSTPYGAVSSGRITDFIPE